MYVCMYVCMCVRVVYFFALIDRKRKKKKKKRKEKKVYEYQRTSCVTRRGRLENDVVNNK